MIEAESLGTVTGDQRGRRRPRPISSRFVEVNDDTPAEHIFRELVAAYLSAAPRVTIHQRGGPSATTQAVIGSFCERLGRGTRIENEGSVIEFEALDDGVTTRLGHLTFRLGERALELLRDAGRTDLPPLTEEQWHRRDDGIDALAWTVHRQVMHAGIVGGGIAGEDRIDPVGWLEASRAIERIADHAVLLSVHWGRWRGTEHGSPESRLLDDIHHQAYEYVSSALVILADPRPATANAALDLGSALRETIDTLLDRLLPARSPATAPPASAVVSLGGILHSIDRVIAYGQDLVEIALDHGRVPRLPLPSRLPRLTSRAMQTIGGHETQ